MDRRGCLAHLHLHCQLPLTPAGWNKRIEYAPGAGSLALFPGIRLETCDEPLWNIQATIELQTNHVAKGCDRDNYSERALRKLCGGCAPLGSPGLSPVAPTPSLCLKLLCLFLIIICLGNSLAVQGVGLCTRIAEGAGSIPDPGTKVLQAVRYGQNQKQKY